MKKVTTIEVEDAVARHFGIRQNIIVPNVSWGFNIHECDMLIVRKSGHCLEVEIKVSKADLLKDKDKRHGHNDYFDRIKELWFAIPEYLENCFGDIPERAGVLVLYENESLKKYYCRTVREPKINSKAVKLADNEILQVARLGTMRIWNLKRKIIDMKNPKKKQSRKRLNEPVLF